MRDAEDQIDTSRRALRVLVLTQWFDPEPTFKGLRFAQALQERGHEVQVLTGYPNYPGGTLYPGYRMKPRMTEVMDGVQVTRVPLYPSHDSSGIRRGANYCSFSLSSALETALCRRSYDVAYVYHPPATIGLAAIVQRRLKRVPFVLDIQDLWPDSLKATGMLSSNWAMRMISSWCSLMYKQAAHIVVLSPGFKDVLCERGIPSSKITTIYNWCDEDAVPGPGAECARASRDRFRVVFAGNMGKAQGLETVLQAAALLLLEEPSIEFLLIGDGVERSRLAGMAVDRRLSNVTFHERVGREQIANVLGSADALLIHLRDDPLFRITIPGKTQAYLAAGRPIILGVQGDAARLVQEAQAGLVCEPENARSLANCIRRVSRLSPNERAEMGEAGRRYYWSHLSMAHGVSSFEHVFRTAIRTGRQRRVRDGGCSE